MATVPEPQIIHVPMDLVTADVVWRLLSETQVADRRIHLTELVPLKKYVQELRNAIAAA